MKLIRLITAAFAIMSIGQFSANAECNKLPDTKCDSIYHSVGSTKYCSDEGDHLGCYTGVYSTSSNFFSCSSCRGNRKLVHVDPQGCKGLADPTECICENGCYDRAWTASGTGYEYSIACGETCNNAKQYRCAKDYYGTPNSTGTSGCNPCPNSSPSLGRGVTQGQTRSAGATSITSCYIAANTSLTDDKGTFKLMSNCPGKN